MAEKIVGIVPHKTNDLFLNELATVIFTVGGIDITTNLQPARTFNVKNSSFTPFFSLDNLPPSENLFQGVRPNGDLMLSFDKRNPKYYAKYGSLLELVRVSVENIVLKYPASINSLENIRGTVGNNVQGAGYFPFDDTMTFAASVNYFSNPFRIYFLDDLNFQYSDERINSLRNLTQNFSKYEIVVDGIAYPILDFTPARMAANDFVRLKVKGRPFDIGNSSKQFYIKPIDNEITKFYRNLEDFEAYLLNREQDYAAIFNARRETDGGVVINYKLKIQWPKLDDYNIDVITNSYDVYLNDLTMFASKYDDEEGNLLMRKLVPENVQSVTLEDANSAFPTFGKINKLLIVYGREIDEINKHIENIKFFNNVTYNKRDNIPEYLIPMFARNLGWDVDVPESIDKDLWRYLIINSWWIWKSKGARKAIEFIFDFLSIPREIVDFNEYVIRARRPIDVEQLEFFYSLLDGEFDIDTLPIDEQGYPQYPSQANDDFFQIAGNSDNGLTYFYKWLNLLPTDFTGGTVNFTGENTFFETLFEQEFDGTGNTLNYSVVDDNLVFNSCYNSSGNTINDPYPEVILDICGCPLPISDKSFEVCIEPVNLSGCTPIILDIYYDCIDETSADLSINLYGGVPPYSVSGFTGTFVTDTFFTGDTTTGVTYQLQAFDSQGCSSDVYTFEIDCQDPCLGTNIAVDLNYTCLLDEFGQNTGQAVVSLNVSGGTQPYNIVGVQDGDIVNHSEVIQVNVIDAEGCESGLVGELVDCEPPAPVACDDISLNATLETTNTEPQFNTAKVNVTYDLFGLPSGLFVDTVTMTSIGAGGDDSYVVGTPVVTTFTTPSGADTISLDFNPTTIQDSISIQVDLHVLLSNGCEYTDNYTMTVDPRQLGNADFYDAILNSI